ELQRLDEELDLADAADAGLHVEPGVERAGRELGLDLLVQLDDVADDVGAGRARVDEGLEDGEPLGAEGGRAGGRSRLDPRLPLPGSAPALVVALQRRQRVDDRSGAALG